MSSDARDLPSPDRPQRAIPVIGRRGQHLANVDSDDLDAVLETGAFELRVGLDSTFLVLKHDDG